MIRLILTTAILLGLVPLTGHAAETETRVGAYLFATGISVRSASSAR